VRYLLCSHGQSNEQRHVRYARTCRGCETWIVREGYEGLVRGNADGDAPDPPDLATTLDVEISDPSFINNLRFGDGALLLDGTGDRTGGRSLKGRYIVRVGWDDVRGWFAEVRAPYLTFPLTRIVRCSTCVLVVACDNRVAL
jgi:6-phosphofructokinase 1